MKIANILFVVLFLIIYSLPNYYLGYRGYKSISRIIPYANSKVYWILFWFIVLSFIFSQIFGKYIPVKINHFLEITGYYWMGAFVYFLMIVALTDIIFFISKHSAPWAYESIVNCKYMPYTGIIIIASVVLLLIYGTFNALHPVVTTYSFSIDKKADNLRSLNAVLVSDLHIGDIVDKKRIEKMAETINSLKPDIVFIAGDTMDQNPDVYNSEKIADVFRTIKTRYGIYACLGNHEYYRGRTDEIVKALNSGGVDVLRDQIVKIDDAFYVAGRDDIESKRYGVNRKNLNELTNGIDKHLPIILLDHQPPRSREPLSEDIDLQLSGHTHGGQLFPSNIITKIVYRLGDGYVKIGNFNLVVTSGYGTWGPPIRIGSSAEIVQMLIKFK